MFSSFSHAFRRLMRGFSPITTWQKLIFASSLLLCAGSLLLVVFLSYGLRQDEARREESAFNNAKREAFLAAVQINRDFAELIPLAKSIANGLSRKTLKPELLEKRLTSELEANAKLFGLGVAFEPDAYKPGLPLYAPYYVKDEQGEIQRFQIEELYDYTQTPGDGPNGADTAWYHNPVNQGSGWNEPYLGKISGAFLAEYAARFYRVDPESLETIPAGIVFAQYSLDDVRRLVASLPLGATGYGYVLSSEGLYIAHPIKELVGNVTLFEQAESLQDEALRIEGERAVSRKIFYREAVDSVTGQASWAFHEPIPSTGWSIGVVLNKDELSANPLTAQRKQIIIALGVMAFLLFLSVLLFRAYKGNSRNVWGVVGAFSVLCIAVMGIIWYLVTTTSLGQSDRGVKLVSKATVEGFLTSNTTLDRIASQNESPVYLPTGIFVQTMEFSGVNEVVVTGYIWQKYPDDIPDWVSEGFILPDEAGRPFVEEAYRRREAGMEVVGWDFRATLRQPFDYSRYPFDHETAFIRFWPKNFDRNVILTPDLEGYRLIKPSLRPGLADGFFVEGWDVKHSMFSYRPNSYLTNFGIDRSIRGENFPELYFHIGLQRNFSNPLIAYIVPLIVVMVMLFAVLMVSGEAESNRFSVLSYCAALFFVITLAHVGLRTLLVPEGIIYLEYFYILAYIILLLVALNSILFTSGANIPFIRFRNNLIPKLLFWPAVLGSLLGISLLTFYP